jgi:hypothetical protein
LQCLLGQVQIAEATDQGREHTRVLAPEQDFDGFGNHLYRRRQFANITRAVATAAALRSNQLRHRDNASPT